MSSQSKPPMKDPFSDLNFKSPTKQTSFSSQQSTMQHPVNPFATGVLPLKTSSITSRPQPPPDIHATGNLINQPSSEFGSRPTVNNTTSQFDFNMFQKNITPSQSTITQIPPSNQSFAVNAPNHDIHDMNSFSFLPASSSSSTTPNSNLLDPFDFSTNNSTSSFHSNILPLNSHLPSSQPHVVPLEFPPPQNITATTTFNEFSNAPITDNNFDSFHVFKAPVTVTTTTANPPFSDPFQPTNLSTIILLPLASPATSDDFGFDFSETIKFDSTSSNHLHHQPVSTTFSSSFAEFSEQHPSQHPSAPISTHSQPSSSSSFDAFAFSNNSINNNNTFDFQPQHTSFDPSTIPAPIPTFPANDAFAFDFSQHQQQQQQSKPMTTTQTAASDSFDFDFFGSSHSNSNFNSIAVPNFPVDDSSGLLDIFSIPPFKPNTHASAAKKSIDINTNNINFNSLPNKPTTTILPTPLNMPFSPSGSNNNTAHNLNDPFGDSFGGSFGNSFGDPFSDPFPSGGASNNNGFSHSSTSSLTSLSAPVTASTPPVVSDDVMEKFRTMYNIPHDLADDNHTNDDDDDNDDGDDDDYFNKNNGNSNNNSNSKQESKFGITKNISTGTNDHEVQLPTQGEILARISTRSMFVKDWQAVFWVIDNENLCLYRNKTDFEHNPRGSQAKKVVPMKHNLRVLKVKAKDYKGKGILYNFMLEEIFDFGPTNLVKFASNDRKAAHLFWEVLKAKIMMKRKAIQMANQHN